MSALERAINYAGGPSGLAKAIGVLPQHVNNWKRRGVSVRACIAIEHATNGEVTREELRPDIFGTDQHNNNDQFHSSTS